jgi:serine/threonine protein phosphatase PrpC
MSEQNTKIAEIVISGESFYVWTVGDYRAIFVNHSDIQIKSEHKYRRDNLVLFRHPDMFNSNYRRDNLLQTGVLGDYKAGLDLSKQGYDGHKMFAKECVGAEFVR